MITTEIVAIILALGTLLPLLTSIVNQPRWSAKTRTVMSVAVSTLAGLVAYVTQFGFELTSVSTIVTFVVGVILASATAYRNLWKPTGVAPAIEASTSGGSAVVAEVTESSPEAVSVDDLSVEAVPVEEVDYTVPPKSS